MLSVSSGYSPDYLLNEVATGREYYYTGAVTDGEPPGRWWGAGAEKLGLSGLVDAQDMRGVYERFLDPRHEGFADPERWDEVPTLGHTGRRYATEDELYAAALEREPDASAERRAELRVEAGKQARHNVAFLDATFSVQKSVTRAAHRVRGRGGQGPRRRRRGRRRGVGRVPPGRRGRHLGGQQRRPVLPAGQGRLRPRRAPRRRRRAVGRRARLGRGVVLPARLPRPRPAAAHPQPDPQPRPGRRTTSGAPSTRGRSTSSGPPRPRSASAPPRSTSPARSGCGSRCARTARPARSSASTTRSPTCSPRGAARSPRRPPS